MGLSRKVFEATGGFQFDRYAEDIELSIRMKNAGFKVGLIEDAFVYHKRRANFRQFFKQVFNFGKGAGASKALVRLADLGKGNYRYISKQNVDLQLIGEAKAKKK